MVSFIGRHKTWAILLLIWLVATSFNLTKAVHIDDTAHLEIARWIMKAPLHPMSGQINWYDTVEPIYHANQPHFLFYLIAVTISVFGESEIALHVALSLFSAGAIFFFFLLASHSAPKHALFLTAIFGLGPAFVPSQNLMTDIPMAALWLAFFWAILSPGRDRREYSYYILAAAVAAAACLIKYVSLVLLPILLLAIVLEKKWYLLWIPMIPILALMGWSVFNYLDYGGIHILGREISSMDLSTLKNKMDAWVIGLGAISPFAIIYVPYLRTRRSGRFLLVGCLVVSMLAFFQSRLYWHESTVYSLLRAGFICCGILSSGAFLLSLLQDSKSAIPGMTPDDKLHRFIMLLWFVGAWAFIILYSPFMAIRHLIMIVPVLLLVTGRSIVPQVKKTWRYAGLAATIFLGLTLGISDWAFANVYRVQANKIQKQLGKATIWYVGHWGWQWYASKAGMKQYDTKLTTLQEGDYLVMPQLVHQPGIARQHLPLLKKIDEIIIDSTPMTFFRIMANEPWGGYYVFWVPRSLPWTISRMPLEKFTVFAVDSAGKKELISPP